MNASEQESYVESRPRAEQIARLNDQFRTTGLGGRVMVTRGVRNLPMFNIQDLVAALGEYDSFEFENDPHEEHDFGDFKFRGAQLFWKIDYYDQQLEWASPDPADPKVTTRVLTVMLESEY